MTKEQLLALAEEHDVSVTRSLLKREIVALLKQSFNKAAKKAKTTGKAEIATKKTDSVRRTTSAKAVEEKPAQRATVSKTPAAKPKIPAQKKSAEVSVHAPASYACIPDTRIEDLAQEAKFVVGKPQIQDETYDEFVNELPSNYGTNKLVMVVRDPYWSYTYWEIQQDRIEKGLKALGKPHHEIRWVLRVHTLPSANTPACVTDIEVQHHVRSWYLQLSPCGASFYSEIGLMDRENNFYRLAVSNRITLPLDRPSDVIDERWMTSDAEFQKLYALSGGQAIGSGSEAVLKGQRMQFGVSSWGPSSFVSSLFSPTPAERQRKFWFWVDAELIVYGGTMPGAKVTLCGQRIQLRPDGTFTARFALPDGTQTIPVTAQSEDNIEIRTITPVVSRNTERPAPVIKEEE